MKRVIAAAALAAVLASPAFADCSKPPSPNIPDGKKATQAQMLAAQQAVADFQTATESYLNCLQKEHDVAASEVDAAVAQFNEQAHRFTAKNDLGPPAHPLPTGVVHPPAGCGPGTTC